MPALAGVIDGFAADLVVPSVAVGLVVQVDADLAGSIAGCTGNVCLIIFEGEFGCRDLARDCLEGPKPCLCALYVGPAVGCCQSVGEFCIERERGVVQNKRVRPTALHVQHRA
jgi:hypothetical protein